MNRKGQGKEWFIFAMEQPPTKCRKLDVIEENTSNSSFDTLPNEVVEIPIKMAMTDMNTQERYNFLVGVIPKVSNRFKDFAAQRSMWKEFAPFEMLPNDVAETIIKMAISDMGFLASHNFLIDVIAKVSSRFQALATLKSLWKGQIAIRGDERKVEIAIEEFLNHGTTSLVILSQQGTTLLAESLVTLPIKCPELEKLGMGLAYGGLRSWPKFNVPLTSLKRLYVEGTDNNLFENVELHHSLPNIEYIRLNGIRGSVFLIVMVLPNMGLCQKLREIRLERGAFWFKTVNDFPCGLKKLSGEGCKSTTLVSGDRSGLEEHFEDCKISGITRL